VLLERIIARLKAWKEKLLSMGTKETLLKAIIQSNPVFAMGVFKIAKSISKNITDAMAAFRWGDPEDQKLEDALVCMVENVYSKKRWSYAS
jgi:hypothetical protein